MKIHLALLTALLTFSSASFASKTPHVRVERLPYEHIDTVLSQEGEDLHAFLRRAGPVFRAYSDRTQFEACAAIGTNAESHTYGLVIGSNHSHLGCVVGVARVPAGMAWTGETIHSHGKAERAFYMNKSDKILAGMEGETRMIPIAGQKINHFSTLDLSGPGGYLATDSGVIYAAKGSDEEISI